MNCNCCNRHNGCIRSVPIFKNLSHDEIVEIEKIVKHNLYPKKTIIYHEEDSLDSLLIINKGKLKLIKYGLDGEEILLSILTPGDLYGGDHIFSNTSANENVIALEDTRICSIKNNDIKELILKNPSIGLKIIEYLNFALNNQKITLEIISMKDTNKKIARFLLETSLKFHSNIISVTQEDIGNFIHLTKETVNRKLSKLQELGIIEIQGQRKIVILDKNKLELFNLKS